MSETAGICYSVISTLLPCWLLLAVLATVSTTTIILPVQSFRIKAIRRWCQRQNTDECERNMAPPAVRLVYHQDSTVKMERAIVRELHVEFIFRGLELLPTNLIESSFSVKQSLGRFPPFDPTAFWLSTQQFLYSFCTIHMSTNHISLIKNFFFHSCNAVYSARWPLVRRKIFKNILIRHSVYSNKSAKLTADVYIWLTNKSSHHTALTK